MALANYLQSTKNRWFRYRRAIPLDPFGRYWAYGGCGGIDSVRWSSCGLPSCAAKFNRRFVCRLQ